MFSLPDNRPAGTSAGTADPEKYIPESQRHALTLPATAGIVDDCTHVRGRSVGMAWSRRLRILMAIIGVWGAGVLLSFAVNRMQIVSVAEQAHARWSILPYRITSSRLYMPCVMTPAVCSTVFRKVRPGISASVWTITNNFLMRCCLVWRSEQSPHT